MFAAVAGLLFACLAPASFAAQQTPKAKPEIPSDPAETTATYGNWVLRCVSIPTNDDAPNSQAQKLNKSCEIVQTIKVKGHAEPIAQLALGRLPNSDSLVMTAVLPVNVSIPGSVSVASTEGADKAKELILPLQWARCAGPACFAVATPKSEKLVQLRKASVGKLEFVDANSRIVGIPLSFAGLDQALNALQKAE
nr:invasion associated locus B family protein [uncultured Cohaesibacter sp.]